MTIVRTLARLMLVPLAVLMSLFVGAGVSYANGSPVGTVELAGTSWLNGRGYDVHSNGTSFTSDHGKLYVNGVYAGYKWQCTTLVNATYLQNGWMSTTWWGDAKNKYSSAPSHLAKQPQGSVTEVHPGDVIVMGAYGKNPYGHVGVVNTVTYSRSGSATFTVINQNLSVVRTSGSLSGGTVTMNTGYPVVGVVHSPLASVYEGRIVQWSGDTKSQKTAWLVKNGKRYWIPDTATYWKLKRAGAGGPDVLPPAILDQLPDQKGQWAS